MKEIKNYVGGLVLMQSLLIFCPSVFAQPAANEVAVIEVNPVITTAGIIGDREKYREINQASDKTYGGFDRISISKQLNHQDSLEFEGRAIGGNNDYDADLTLAREGVGSLEISFKEFRKYYEGTGGTYSQFAFGNGYPVELDKNIHLDIGNFKIEGILAKENAPEYSLSYERASRNGSKSLLNWGYVTGSVSRKLYPNFLETDEVTNKVKAGIKHVTRDSESSIEQSWEAMRSENKDIQSRTYTLSTGAISSLVTRFLNMDSDLYSTVLRYSKDLNKKLTVNCGLLYNRYIGGSMENMVSTSATSNYPDHFGIVDQNSVTLFPNISFIPSKNLLVSFGSKAELINKNGSANYDKTGEAMNIKSEIYKKIFTQNFGIKYKGFKNIALYTDADFEKRLINQFDDQESYAASATADNFSIKTNTITDNINFTVGGKWYMNSKLNLTLEEKSKSGHTNNDHEFKTGDITTLGGTYRGFIDEMKFNTHTPLVKLNYKPFRWLSYNFGYTHDSTVYGVRTMISNEVVNAKYNSNNFSWETTLTPADYLYLTIFYEKKFAKTKTRASDQGTAAYDQPSYQSGVDVFRFNGSFAFTKNTSLEAGFSMYNSANFHDYTTGLPLGLDNTFENASFGIKHNFTKDRSLELKYSFQKYDEDSNNNIDDYEAHILSAAMRMAF